MGSKTPFDDFQIEELPDDLHHWRNAFDARFIRHEVLEGKPRTVLVTKVQWLKSSNRNESKRQLLVSLQEFEKPWAINVTNSETIAGLYGVDPRGWVGKRVTLYPTKTKFGREVVDCIRVREEPPPGEHRSGTPPGETPRQVLNRELRQQSPARHPLVTELLQAMADATQVEALDGVEERLTEANELSREDTAFLVKQLTRRRGQLGPAESK